MSQNLQELMAARGLTREAVFAESWEARAFALALMLSDRGTFEWEAFRQRLIAAIAEADAAKAAGREVPTYYECWMTALAEVLGSRSLLDGAELDARAAEIAAHAPEPTRALSAGPIKIA
jgi:nitrile hydratase accessory protein